MARRKRILLTNDDGYFSEGITALFDALSKHYDVCMFAPDREQSASSHSLTLSRPLRIDKLDSRRYITDGTPTDCVMLAVHGMLRRKKPDMIISGINHGANLGDDVTYSGTVAAAIEGSILKIPAMAVSMVGWRPGLSMRSAAEFVARFSKQYDSLGLDPSTFLNINLPTPGKKGYGKVAFTSLGLRRYKDIVVNKIDPRGKPYYWIAGEPTWTNTPGSDFEAVKRGLVSVTPLKLNFTDQETLSRLKELEKNLAT
ncbi:MAG: 5'/3'-nucleotidase SurE [Candidatus Zixiibacteriota bacterium]